MGKMIHPVNDFPQSDRLKICISQPSASVVSVTVSEAFLLLPQAEDEHQPANPGLVRK